MGREGCEPGFARKGVGSWTLCPAERGRSAALGDSLARRGAGLDGFGLAASVVTGLELMIADGAGLAITLCNRALF